MAGERDRVDPGVVALNYAWNEGSWAVGMGALKILEPEPKDAQTLQQRMLESLDWSRLHEEDAQLLLRLTGDGILPRRPYAQHLPQGHLEGSGEY